MQMQSSLAQSTCQQQPCRALGLDMPQGLGLTLIDVAASRPHSSGNALTGSVWSELHLDRAGVGCSRFTAACFVSRRPQCLEKRVKLFLKQVLRAARPREKTSLRILHERVWSAEQHAVADAGKRVQ